MEIPQSKEVLTREEEATPVKKIKLLAWGDSPTCATGFAQVMRNVLRTLYDTGLYDITVVGINHTGDPYDYAKMPYKIYPAVMALNQNPAYQDLFGRQRLMDLLGTGEFDLLFTLQDTFIVQEVAKVILETRNKLPKDRAFTWIYYFPIDAVPKESWVKEAVSLSDFPVTYTKYAYEECIKKDETLREKLNVIYHGVDVKTFHPLDEEKVKEVRKQFFSVHSDKFIFANVNRNQPRKDVYRTMEAFAKLRKKRDDVFLYLHMQPMDSGFNLFDIDKQLNLKVGEDWGIPNPQVFTANQGFPLHVLNELYNSVDCIMSTTLGEGWGLSTVEAMACKKPILFPDNTSLPEIIGANERGLLVDSGKVNVVLTSDNNRIRPLTDVDDLVKKMEWMVDNKEKRAVMAQNGYNWVQTLTWDGVLIGDKWKKIFEEAFKQNVTLRMSSKLFGGLGRNDECPVCKKKFKTCMHYEKFGK